MISPAVTVCIMEVEASPLMQMVDLAILLGIRAASIRDTLLHDPAQDRIELFFSCEKSVVMTLETRVVVEVQGQGVVDPDGGEMAPRPPVLEPEDSSDKPRRFLMVVGGDDRVVEMECHNILT